MKTIYEWTGEFRPPKKGEWYLYFDLGIPDQALGDFHEDDKEFILSPRQEEATKDE